MPLTKRSKKAAEVRGLPASARVIVASGARLDRQRLAGALGMGKGAVDWQTAAWDYYASIPELRFGINWIANALSRCRLVIVEGDTADESLVPITEGPEVDRLNELFAGPAGQARMLQSIGYQLNVPGEFYLIGYVPDMPEPGADAGAMEWVVASREELRKDGDRIVYDNGGGAPVPLDADAADTVVIRGWLPLPRRSAYPDSAVHALIMTCREIEELTKKVFAHIDSRLSGPGLFLVPDEADVQTEPTPNVDAEDDTSLMAQMTRAFTTAIRDQNNASAVVPIVLRVPMATVESFKRITFGDELDAEITPMRDAAIKRVALGLNIPPEAILGMADANHWSAWQIEESAVRIHIAPIMATICDIITRYYMWPLTNNRQRVVWFDTSDLTEAADRGPAARDVHAAGGLSDAALRRYNGFNEDDKPTDDERKLRLLLQLLPMLPQLAPLVMDSLGLSAADTATVNDTQPAGELPPSEPEPQDTTTDQPTPPRDPEAPPEPDREGVAAAGPLLAGAGAP